MLNVNVNFFLKWFPTHHCVIINIELIVVALLNKLFPSMEKKAMGCGAYKLSNILRRSSGVTLHNLDEIDSVVVLENFVKDYHLLVLFSSRIFLINHFKFLSYRNHLITKCYFMQLCFLTISKSYKC